jgi:S1-C subfamily serine protease
MEVRMKKDLSLIFMVLLLISMHMCFFNTNAKDNNIKIILDGQSIEFSENQEPRIENGSTLIPMRIIFEMLQANVVWDNNTRSVTSTKDGVEVILQENKNTMIKNGKESIMPAETKIINGFMFVPLRAVSEAFNAIVLWNGETETVSINLNNRNDTNSNYITKTYDVSNLYNKALEQKNSIVQIETFDSKDESLDIGSGVIISTDGKIATSYHKIKNSFSGLVTIHDGRKFKIESVFAFDTENDLAIIKIDSNGLKYVELGDSDKLNVSDKIITIASQGAISEGIISAIRKDNTSNLIQITAPLSYGSGGGGLFDISGKLIGIIEFGYNGGEGNLNFCSPVNFLKTINNQPNNKKLYELINADMNSNNSIEINQDNLKQKFTYIKIDTYDLKLEDIILERQRNIYNEKEYYDTTMKAAFKNENFNKYCNFLKSQTIDEPYKMKKVQEKFYEVWIELKKMYPNDDINIEIYANGDEEFKGLPPYFAKVHPDNYKFEYKVNKFIFNFEIFKLFDQQNYIKFLHRYDFFN